MRHRIRLDLEWVVGCCCFIANLSQYVHCTCISKQPDTCYILSYDQDENNSYNREQLNRSIVHATENLTVYESNKAVFRFQVNRSVISDVAPDVYVDGCKDDLKGDTCKKINDTIIECRFNVTIMADNGKKIVFYAYSPSVLKGAQLCHQPFSSYLTVLGKPVTRANVNYTFDNCESIRLLFSQTNDSTYTEYKLLDHNGHLLLEDVYNITTHSVLICSHMLSNHTGVYSVMVTPTNPAGDGPSTELILDLKAINILSFDVTKITVEASKFGFIGQIYVKVNTSCPLTIPNIFYVNSSCSNITEEHRGHHFNGNMIILSHRLQPYRHNCSITVSDEVGTNQTLKDRISTFHTQSYDIQVLSDSVDVKCTFIFGTTAMGCAIVIYKSNKKINSTKPVHTKQYSLHYSGYVNTGHIPPGNYTLHICDAMDNTFNHSTAVVVFKEDFVIVPKNTTSSSTMTSSIVPSSSPMQSSTSVLPPFTLIVSVTVIGSTGIVLVLALVLVLVVVVWIKMKKSSKGHEHTLQNEASKVVTLLKTLHTRESTTHENAMQSTSTSSGKKVIAETEFTHEDTSNGSVISDAENMPEESTQSPPVVTPTLTKRQSDDSKLSSSSLNTPVPTPTSSLTPETTENVRSQLISGVPGVPGHDDTMVRSPRSDYLLKNKGNGDELVAPGHGSKTKSDEPAEAINEPKTVQDYINNTSSTVTGGHSQFALPSNNTTTTTDSSYSSITGLIK